jgi:hypothetical protein
MRRYPAPFDNGFTEFEYRVLESTNLQGLAFPKKAVVKYFGINPEDRNRLTVMTTYDINVARISFDETQLAKQVRPKWLDGLYYRPGTRVRGEFITVITNDEWLRPAR